jgi:hypothetical protein
MRVGFNGALAALAASILLLASAGCTGVLGDFTIGDGGSTTDGPGADVVGAMDSGHGDAKADGGTTDSPADAPLDALVDAPIDAPPPVPGKPGLDITAGGNWSKSTSYKLIGAVGESPGNNALSTSTSYKLHGGVVAITQ